MNVDTLLRGYLVKLLDWRDAHVDFDAAIKDWPVRLRGKTTPGLAYTAWQLLEHMRIAQSDILEFSRDAKHVSPAWPESYWPVAAAPPTQAAWEESIREFKRDRMAMQRFVSNPRTDLFAPIAHGDGQTVFREAVLIADHNAYHLGQLVLLRRLLGAWR